MTTSDWTGNSKAIYSCHGASNHSDTEREANDYYATPPSAVEMLLGLEGFSEIIMEPACGEGLNEQISILCKRQTSNKKGNDGRTQK